MQKPLKNYAFIDSQNLNLGIRKLGWRLDYKKFRVYLKEKYHVEKAFLFLGYLKENEKLYQALRSYGYILIFKPTVKDRDGKAKGNIDADLVLKALVDYNKYDKAVIITSDGDFYCLIKYFYRKNKLELTLSPNFKRCSRLVKISAREKIDFMNDLKDKLKI